MPTTSPDAVRRGLQVVTSSAQADLRTVAAAAESPTETRAALFAAAPLIVGTYQDGSSALALDWYDELRQEAGVGGGFTPSPFTMLDEEALQSTVAWATSSLYDLEQQALRTIEGDAEALLRQATEESLRLLEPEIQLQVASGYWDTITGNVANDDEAVGWQRFARGGACKFCLMLSGRGAVYTESTARFAAHTSCHCVAGPSFDPDAPKADAMQYVASKRQRTEKERADLRKYLNRQFPDAPG